MQAKKETMNVTVTYYCEGAGCDSQSNGIGCVDNLLKAGDVALKQLKPIKQGKGKAKFTYIEFQGREYRVADTPLESNRLDIYIPNQDVCRCSKFSKFPRIQDQRKAGGYTITILRTVIEQYEDQDN